MRILRAVQRGARERCKTLDCSELCVFAEVPVEVSREVSGKCLRGGERKQPELGEPCGVARRVAAAAFLHGDLPHECHNPLQLNMQHTIFV